MNALSSAKKVGRGFSLIELLFAIMVLGIGILGILSVFTTGLSSAAWSENASRAAICAQSLLARIKTDVDPAGSGAHVYLDRIEAPGVPAGKFPSNAWIHANGNSPDPVLADPDPTAPSDASKAKSEFWWQCRASINPMDQTDPLDASKDDVSHGPYPRGLYQLAIAVYRNVKPGLRKKPIAVYTTMVSIQQ